MTKSQLDTFRRLSKDEKIELVQLLWDDISADVAQTEMTEDHKRKLEETLNNIASGKTSFRTWEEARAKYITHK